MLLSFVLCWVLSLLSCATWTLWWSSYSSLPTRSSFLTAPLAAWLSWLSVFSSWNALTMVPDFPGRNSLYFSPHSTGVSASTWFLTAPRLPSAGNLPAPKSLAQFELQFCLILLRVGNGCFDVWYLWTWKAPFPLTVHWAGQCLSLLIKNVIKDLTSRKKCIKKKKRCSIFLLGSLLVCSGFYFCAAPFHKGTPTSTFSVSWGV